MDILELIPRGEENAISRKELVEKTGMRDRLVRERIEQLRHQGEIICFSQRGGYFLPASVDDVVKMYYSDLRRAKSILHRLKAMRYLLKKEGISV